MTKLALEKPLILTESYQQITDLLLKVYELATLCGDDNSSAWCALEEIKHSIQSFYKTKKGPTHD